MRDAITEKLERLFAQPSAPNEPPPLSADPEISLRTSSDRPRKRDLRHSEAATRAKLHQLTPATIAVSETNEEIAS